MKQKIKSIWQAKNGNSLTVEYKSGHRRTYYPNGLYFPHYELPETVKTFLDNAMQLDSNYITEWVNIWG